MSTHPIDVLIRDLFGYRRPTPADYSACRGGVVPSNPQKHHAEDAVGGQAVRLHDRQTGSTTSCITVRKGHIATILTRGQPDTDWLISILEHECDEADALLSLQDAMTDLEESGFYADWPLLASWWERIIERDRHEPLTAEQRERVDAVVQTIRRLMPTIRELVGPEMAHLDGLDVCNIPPGPFQCTSRFCFPCWTIAATVAHQPVLTSVPRRPVACA
jgi:hypothetical protein